MGDARYPERLLDLPDPPSRLFAIGDLDLLHGGSVAIVGTRSATPYGERATREIAGALASVGVTVVSGMARGIDATAHRAALDAGGATTAVLGTGVDVPYPAAHHRLHAEIGRHGLLVSEELPGARALAGSFPRRNRIIAGLAKVTIVVEAGSHSGALITAAHALDLGRTVAAVPGPIDSPQSAGSNELLRDGAVVIATVDDALALFGMTRPAAAKPLLDCPAQRAVWQALERGGADADALTNRCALPVEECLAALGALELAGLVECTLTGEFRRRSIR